MADFVGAIDQGTTSTRFAVVDRRGRIAAMAQQEHRQVYPRPGWVEHDAAEIRDRAWAVVQEALSQAGLGAADLAAVGVTNQRETTVVWDRATGEPLAPAIVWQDTRTADLCAALAAEGGPDRFRAATGLPLATYFSGPKLAWLLERGARPARPRRGGRGPLRQRRLLADLESDRPPRHRRDQRLPDPADGSRAAGLGAGPHLGHGDPPGDAPGDPSLGRGVRGGARAPGRGSHRRRPGRPAGRPVRPGLLPSGPGQEHLRHRLLPAPQHR